MAHLGGGEDGRPADQKEGHGRRTRGEHDPRPTARKGRLADDPVGPVLRLLGPFIHAEAPPSTVMITELAVQGSPVARTHPTKIPLQKRQPKACSSSDVLKAPTETG